MTLPIFVQKVAIKDIFISDITSQLWLYIKTLDNRDYEEISNFLILAATLLEIKSSELLPKIDFEDINPDELSDADLFILRTEEYSMYRNVANKLQEMEILHRFYRSPEYDQNDYKIIIKNFNIDKMILAFTNLLENVDLVRTRKSKTIPLEIYCCRQDEVYHRIFKYIKLQHFGFERDFSNRS